MIDVIVCFLQVTLVASFTVMISKLCLSRSPNFSTKACTIGMLFCALLVLATFFEIPRLQTRFNLRAERQTSTSPSPVELRPSHLQSEAAEKPSSSGLSLSLENVIRTLSRIEHTPSSIERRITWGCFVAVGLCVCFTILKLGIGMKRVWHLHQSAEFTPLSPVNHQVQSLKQQTGFSRTIRVFTCDRIASPCVTWLRRGTIFVPSDFDSWDDEEQTVALTHEICHEVRSDPFWRLLAEVCLSLVCFHPLMFMLRNQLIFSQELATDQAAAKCLGSTNRYRRGLSALALRMDSQPLTPFLVSVSTSNVVRRIKMLSRKTRSLSKPQEIILMLAVISGCGVFTAWSVHAEDPVRVATRQSDKNATTGDISKARTILPWENLGEREGYVVLQPGVLAGHPVLRKIYKAHLDEATNFRAEQLDLSPEEVKSIQLPLANVIREIPEGNRSQFGGDRYQSQVVIDSIFIETTRPVQWNNLMKVVPDWLSDEHQQWLTEELSKYNNRTVLALGPKIETPGPFPHTEAVRAAWSLVQQCPAATVSAIPEDLHLKIKEKDDKIHAGDLFEVVESVALGIDTIAGELRLHLVLVPPLGTSVSILRQRFERSKLAALEWRRDSSESLGNATAKYLATLQLIEDFESATIETHKNPSGGELLVLTMNSRVDLRAFLAE